jgi:hypothetical protein
VKYYKRHFFIQQKGDYVWIDTFLRAIFGKTNSLGKTRTTNETFPQNNSKNNANRWNETVDNL